MNMTNTEITKNEKAINILRFLGLREVFADLRTIDYALIKGETTSIYAFGQTNKRYYNDIDLLVKKKELFKIEKVLLKNGFVKTTSNRQKELFFNLFSHQTVPYEMTYKGIHILMDLNYDIFWGENKVYNSYQYVNDFLSDVIDMEIYGVNVKVLAPKKAFMQLCLHCYKDINSIYLIYSRRHINVNALYEIYYILTNPNNGLSVESVAKLGDKYMISKYIYVVLSYIYELTKDPMIQPYINSLRNEEGQELLNAYGLNKHKKWKIGIGERITCSDLYDTILPDLSEEDLSNIIINDEAFSAD